MWGGLVGDGAGVGVGSGLDADGDGVGVGIGCDADGDGVGVNSGSDDDADGWGVGVNNGCDEDIDGCGVGVNNGCDEDIDGTGVGVNNGCDEDIDGCGVGVNNGCDDDIDGRGVGVNAGDDERGGNGVCVNNGCDDVGVGVCDVEGSGSSPSETKRSIGRKANGMNTEFRDVIAAPAGKVGSWSLRRQAEKLERSPVTSHMTYPVCATSPGWDGGKPGAVSIDAHVTVPSSNDAEIGWALITCPGGNAEALSTHTTR